MTIALLALLVAALVGWTLHAGMLRNALDRAWDDQDRISAELDAAHVAGAALVDRYWRAERRAGRQFVRSFKRRSALVRVARYCRATRDDLAVADTVFAGLAAGLHEQTVRYDAAIEALAGRVAELTARETSASIAQWADATFGPVESNMSIWKRADTEFQELRLKLTEDDTHPRAAEEAADVCIVLDRLVHRLGSDMMQERQRKMATNRARRWKLIGDGHGQHIDTATAPEPAP